MGHKASVTSTLVFYNIEIVIVKSSLTLLNRIPKSEGEPVSISINNPSLDDFKRMYKAATTNPNRWLTILWEDGRGKAAFDVVSPYRNARGPRRKDILQALSPKPGNEGKLLHAVIIIQEIPKNEVAAKKPAPPAHIPIPAAFQKTVEELNLDNL